MLLLVTTGHPDIAERYRHPLLGRLVQPRHYSSIEATAKAGIPWAADNDAFGNFDAEAFAKMLSRLRGLAGCLFVACPDRLADVDATMRLYEEWRPRLSDLPVALVAQDGLAPGHVPWGEIAALFIGGTDSFKLGPDAETLIAEAHRRGKWVHVGRVNSYPRIRYCATLGVDSVDGSGWAIWKRVWLRAGLGAVGQPPQLRLGEA